MSQRIDYGGSRNRRSARTPHLWRVLVLNLARTAGFLGAGLIGDSSALIANGLDNLSDAAVYALSLVALRHGLAWKRRAATFSFNDFMANGGILVAGILVLLLGANWLVPRINGVTVGFRTRFESGIGVLPRRHVTSQSWFEDSGGQRSPAPPLF